MEKGEATLTAQEQRGLDVYTNDQKATVPIVIHWVVLSPILNFEILVLILFPLIKAELLSPLIAMMMGSLKHLLCAI